MSNIDDLIVLPPAKDSFNRKNKMKLHPYLPNFHTGQLILLCAAPAQGKSVLLLNLLGNKNFLRYYYDEVHMCGSAFQYDTTLAPIIDYYGNCYDDCSDSVINSIIKSRLEQDQETKGNCCIVIDDLMSMPSFNSTNRTALSKLSSIYRHVLGGALPTANNPEIPISGGLLIVSNQRLFQSIPRNLRSCASTILLGRVMNKEEYGKIISEYGMMFGGEKQFKNIMQECHEEKYGFMCIYLQGVLDENIEGPAIFKNFNQLMYPSQKYPKKNYQITDTISN